MMVEIRGRNSRIVSRMSGTTVGWILLGGYAALGPTRAATKPIACAKRAFHKARFC